jgi:hypothetical protein
VTFDIDEEVKEMSAEPLYLTAMSGRDMAIKSRETLSISKTTSFHHS